MAIAGFPPVEFADDSGLLAVGGDLDCESLVLAYESGIFPWPLVDHQQILWFAPPMRAVIFFENFRPSRSLRRRVRRNSWSFFFNKAFSEVVAACAQPRASEANNGTWITKSMQEAYCRLHQQGYAHSIECYEGKELIGGLYGVSIGKMFAGESMFYRRTDASKACLWILIEFLRKQGFYWIDCQVSNSHLRSLGATDIDRRHFMRLLRKACKKPNLTAFDSGLELKNVLDSVILL